MYGDWEVQGSYNPWVSPILYVAEAGFELLIFLTLLSSAGFIGVNMLGYMKC
jgi:ABC-type cobalt transport system substrate-binding protein